ncbi:MAG: hypothetical protein B2I17_01815 [Thermoplasmatales archaeon B_DKE]|nr:MAG: hypothetical protein B2I17_01815 [Thermoplasmatales archaeon B_DKE]
MNRLVLITRSMPDRVRVAGYYTNFVQSVRDSIGFENFRSKGKALNTILLACKKIRVYQNKVYWTWAGVCHYGTRLTGPESTLSTVRSKFGANCVR